MNKEIDSVVPSGVHVEFDFDSLQLGVAVGFLSFQVTVGLIGQ